MNRRKFTHGKDVNKIHGILLLFVEYSVPMYATNDVAFIDSETLSPCPSDNTVRLLRVTSTGHEDVC
jgi:hypothetical protein